MKTHKRRTRKRIHSAWIAVLATLLVAPAAWSHGGDDEHDGNYYDYYDSNDCYCEGDYGHSRDHHVGDPYFSARHEISGYGDLAGYGCWRWVPRANDYLWFPYVEAAWRPYYNGHWINTSYGMTWVSYEPWGEIPHHYGRWVYVDRVGWGWVPGYDYAPAWVTWGVVDGYVGWAPLPPQSYRYARHHRYRPGRYHVDYRYGGSFEYHTSGLDFALWIFVNDYDFYGSSIHSCAVPVERTLSLFKSKRVLPVGRKLHADYVRQVSKKEIKTVRMDQRTKKIGGKETVFHEPRGQKDKIGRGQEVTRKTIAKPKVRRNETKLRVSKDAAGKRAADKVKAPRTSKDAPRKVAAVDRTQVRTNPKKVVKKQRVTPRETREAVRQQPKPKLEKREAVRKQAKPQVEKRATVNKQAKPKFEKREAVKKQTKPKLEKREAVKKQAKPKLEKREATKKQSKAKPENAEAAKKKAKRNR